MNAVRGMVFNTYLFARYYQWSPKRDRLAYICSGHRVRVTINDKVF